MKRLLLPLTLAAALAPTLASAQSSFQAILTGLGENPSNGSSATGFGTVVLSLDQTQITVNESWTGLSAPATASHIHGPGGTGTNGPVLFPFTGVLAATSGSIAQQVFSITPTQVGYLEAGYLYMNIHDASFPGGEIRGQLVAVPEPGVTTLLTLGLAGMAAIGYRRRQQS